MAEMGEGHQIRKKPHTEREAETERPVLQIQGE